MKQFDFSVLKTLRLKHDMTSEQLAGKAAVTRATIAKMESGFGNPTVQTLHALAGAFGITSSELLRLAEGVNLEAARVERFVRPEYEGKRIWFDNFEVFWLKAGKGTRMASEFELHEDTAEICLVLSGHLVLTVGEQKVAVTEGMAVRFRAMHEHCFDAVEDVEFLTIHPNFR